ncbi:SAM-dependent methyltransferase [Candidatus Nitrosoglobus terrae]|uniref:SAM-dependent methyltransferase n=1 Tax=Candidatus Nitrosoglobus terrae TaxID=1630141 RepID=A0A1Q2SNI0_9GAMM|nr:class I SAM-dependent rRNA methyltransferase [Candidatus Nitrosoglobus terrae]BAW80696.1 SAM-dependent methyltransferase [Candidatus Nitrosoglobus terrae]
MEFQSLYLKKGEERRLQAGHLWVFSNEVDTHRTPITNFSAGTPVTITTHNDKVIGTGYVNPHSLICARLVSRNLDHPFGFSLLIQRLKFALSFRSSLFLNPYYRLIFGESDGLPGLTIDRYGNILIAQITTAGMERIKETIIAALNSVLPGSAIILRNDSSFRRQEGLESYVEVAQGQIQETIRLAENEGHFLVPLINGQKTGWFFDHRLNRARMQHYVKDKRVLDVFSYLGAWGIQASVAGARQVIGVEGSETAIEFIRHNAKLNSKANSSFTALHGDAFSTLNALQADKERFDVIILDPPAFIKRKKDLKQGLIAYQRLNELAIRLLTQDGILISSSCSSHLQWDIFRDILRRSGRHLDRSIQILEHGHQGPDHPIHPAIPETEYLKTFICRSLYGA